MPTHRHYRSRLGWPAAAIVIVVAGAALATPPTKKKHKPEVGGVSYYHPSLAGNPTASGEKYDPAVATCAHKTHAFGTVLKVTLLNPKKKKGGARSVTCRVNDRGPFVKGRVVDVSQALAQQLGILKSGVAEVRVEVVKTPAPR